MVSMTPYSRLQSFFSTRSVEDDDIELVHRADHISTEIERGSHAQESGRLGLWTWTSGVAIFLDGLMAIVPLLFIVLGIVAASLNGIPTSSLGETVERFMLLAPTVFPIVFAALVGKFFRLLATYKAQSGVTLQMLEQLMGCQSLFSALERQILLRCTNFMGFGITILWVLSPLGGQSALRLVARVPHMVSSTVAIRYLPTEISQSTYMGGSDLISEGWPSYAPIYMAALMTTQNQDSSATDLWGNVKIPTIDSLSTEDGTYYEIDQTKAVKYSSLLGVPIAMLPDTGKSSFDITAQYWRVSCHDLYKIDNYTEPWNTTRSSYQMTPRGAPTSTAQGFDVIALSQYYYLNTSVSVANCTLSLRTVIPRITCTGKTCVVTQMRLSEPSAEDDLRIRAIALSNTLYALPLATIGFISHQAQGSIEGSTTTEKWIMNPTTNYSDTFSLVDLSTLSLDTFSSRFSLVYNTFWQSTFASSFRLGNLSTTSSDYDNISILAQNYSFNHTTADTSRSDGEQYSCHWFYVIALWTICGLLFLIACTTLFLRTRILVPDVLGCASTMLRDNKFAGCDGRIPSYLDGVEATRRLPDMKVMLGDVAGAEDTGHIAFASLDVSPRRLKKGRTYN